MAERQCVVFDLDGTLVASDSFGRLVARVLRRSPARLCLAAVTAPVWLLLGARAATRLQAERIVVWTATVGLDRARFEALLHDFAAEHAGEPGGRRIPLALQRLRQHVEAGDRVVVATACAEPLAREVCHVLGLRGVEVVAGSFTPHRWRLPGAVPTRGEGKLRALRAAGVELPVDHAYSDSVADLPLLLAARTAHLVRPSPRHLPLLLRALGPEVEVLR
ncbi:phosphatidylglycerophosphatase C [Kineococcus xinjiangensis]|uniref:Phosphatidylglycerophosphatase C n=1 Tax=Kineococcus xinjiangensis TaxID=512762 RepID=A0A2S6IH31_9ACTN|nr:haloacid dehalogenase-like hydrolase [Kineococcus xinjiangensis]PPK93523.1 phosphatidylglycerophosphatase C [Kineococcus xinjiangensis]